MVMDELLYKVADQVKNFAVIYLCDITQVKDFNAMYGMCSSHLSHASLALRADAIQHTELVDPCTVMFFWNNKHMMCDFGTGNNNKLNFKLENKQQLIDIIEVIYKAGTEGKGLAGNLNKDFSTKHRY